MRFRGIELTFFGAFTGFYLVSVWFRWIVSIFWVLPVFFIRFYWVLLGFTGFYWVSLALFFV